MFLINNSSLSKRNMNPALISGRERLYCLEDPLKQQHMTYQFSWRQKGSSEITMDRNALYFKIKEGDQIVGDSGYTTEPSRIVVWRDEHTQQYRNSWQEFAVIRRLFLRSQGLENSQAPFCLWKGH
jgi:hypothetical protein